MSLVVGKAKADVVPECTSLGFATEDGLGLGLGHKLHHVNNVGL
jgi:hypothetical protein